MSSADLSIASRRTSRRSRALAALAALTLAAALLGALARPQPAPAAPLTSGMVSITFDDGWRSQWDLGRPQLRSRGMVATYYLITDPIRTGDSCCVTTANVTTLASEGNEIASHSVTHRDLSTLSAAEVDNELSASRSWFASTFGITPTNFATPYGATNPIVDSRIRAYYRSSRSISPALADATTYLDALPGIDVHAGVTVASVRALLDRAASEKRWAILTFHDLVASGASTSTTYNVADFTAILDYVRTKGLPVVTMAQGVARLNGAYTPVTPGATSVYDNQLVNGFTDWSWAARQLDQSRLVRTAPNAIEADLGNWSGLMFHTPGLAVTPSDVLELWVNGGPSGGQSFRLTALRNGTVLGQVPVTTVLGRTVPANTWTRVATTMSSLGVTSPMSITELAIEGNVGAAQPLLSVDDVRILQCTPTTTTTTSTTMTTSTTTTTGAPTTTTTTTTTFPPGGGEVVYGDALGAGWADWSWATRNLAATSPVLGTRSIVWEPDAWKGLYLHSDRTAAAASTVRFSMHGGASGGQGINVFVAVNGTLRVTAAVSSIGGPIPAGAWRTYDLVVPGGIAAGASVELTWQDATGLDQAAVALDAISLTSAAPVTTTSTIPPTTTTAPPTTTTTAPTAIRTVYDDTLVDADDWGWATRNYASTSPVQAGTRAIAVQADPWTGIQIHLRTPYTVTAASRVSFWINGEVTGGQPLQLQLRSSGSLRAAVDVSTLLGGPVPAGRWQRVDVSLASLGIAGGSLSELVLYANTGTPGGRYSFDTIAFTS